jgi:hypothetical protein
MTRKGELLSSGETSRLLYLTLIGLREIHRRVRVIRVLSRSGVTLST